MPAAESYLKSTFISRYPLRPINTESVSSGVDGIHDKNPRFQRGPLRGKRAKLHDVSEDNR